MELKFVTINWGRATLCGENFQSSHQNQLLEDAAQTDTVLSKESGIKTNSNNSTSMIFG